MKTIALLLGMFITSLVAQAQDTDGITLTLTIENIISSEGNVLTALHSEETFMKGPGIQNKMEKAKKGSISVEFKNIAPGTYALSALHDENENQKMDFEDNGMPKEKYAMSGTNNKMGPPSFSDVNFEVGEEDMNIHLKF